MKIFENIFSDKKIDFSSLQIFISVIAILAAHVIAGSAQSFSHFDFYKSPTRTIARVSDICSALNQNTFCEKKIITRSC